MSTTTLLSQAGKQKILTFANVFRSKFADSFGNFLEKSTAASTSLVVDICYSRLGPALCAGSLLVFNIILNNSAIEDKQNKEIYDILNRATRGLVAGWNQANIKGATNLIEQLLEFQLLLAKNKPVDADYVKLKSLTQAVLDYLNSHSDNYAAYISVHLKFLEDVNNRSEYYRLTATEQQLYLSQLDQLNKKYMQKLQAVYYMGQKEIEQMYPDKKYESGDYNARFNHLQQYPLYSKVFCQTTDVINTMINGPRTQTIGGVNKAAMDSYRMSSTELQYYLYTEKAHFYVSDIKRILIYADTENIYAIQNDYIDSFNNYSKRYGENKGEFVIVGAIDSPQLMVNQIPNAGGSLKYIGLPGSNQKFGASNHFKLPVELVGYAKHKIGRINGIARATSENRKTDFYGLIFTMFPSNVNFFTNLSTTTLTIINGSKVDYATPIGNYEIMLDHQNIGMDSIKARNSVLYNVECRAKATKFIINIFCELFTAGLVASIRTQEQEDKDALTFKSTANGYFINFSPMTINLSRKLVLTLNRETIIKQVIFIPLA
ncbi:hypothetical protein PPL_10624 [Heterostelium album PN500]|uniref:Pesticidal crystal protein domain-containing protein n=1 Tax=Heterostelium pallidum (strain ATCC 26659 / Pp 5 / PN500) TaxID=670386 RepID=D3BRL3_HETP5|nr:hypothetical protein PPL_10624 [Heterostelium album PN500]EFA76045.1 hypothetical protein PPL_10624 [Heterostelium album PN500]|eukprot:XP_020428179.1 hypothetical protein PPL_10624 [Heterostelium album PN500]